MIQRDVLRVNKTEAFFKNSKIDCPTLKKEIVEKLSIKEKIGYALGDGAANIAWRGVATFLFIF